MEVPVDILNKISDCLEASEQCYFHKQTFEVITYPAEYLLELEPGLNIWEEDIKKVESDKNFIQIKPMASHHFFKIMEAFTNSVPDRSVKIRLLTSLDGRKPFARFKHEIDNSGYIRNLWFEYRRTKNINWVKDQLKEIFDDRS